MRSRSLTVAAVGILVTALMPLPATAEPAASSCVVTGGTPAVAAALRTAAPDEDGTYPYQEWLVGEKGQRATAALVGVEDRIFGHVPSSATVTKKVTRGLIGFAPDYSSQSLVAVVTPEYAGTPELAKQLADAQSSLGEGAPELRVQTGCFSATAIADAYAVLTGTEWRNANSKFAYAFHLDPVDSKFHVTVDAAQTKAAEKLAALLGDRGVVELGPVGRTGRLNDGEPHFGGAGIRKNYSSNTASNTCTSGFMVRSRSTNGIVGMTTAGHCFATGDSVYSSTQYYGVSQATIQGEYPSTDARRVYSSAETYDNVIHVEPCSPCTRTVTSRTYVTTGSSGICSSGMVTTAICSLTVISVTGQICDGVGCTAGLLVLYRNGETIVRAGDSGGPVYLRNGSTTASAVGQIVGGAGTRTNTSTYMYAESFDSIEAALDVYIATS
ncbi:hypothetical protein HDA40_006426 [Hamadaea flava]|uniref:S1 family peptidase n=1 Tax=Hamadaea flava TaxID=1742688 RepID=A0ABV8LTE8_9ACTN|nr:S1 family peptidase [Hamadaea flava]MCP2327919.1 hypothetical protein [Hamadaea flava]